MDAVPFDIGLNLFSAQVIRCGIKVLAQDLVILCILRTVCTYSLFATDIFFFLSLYASEGSARISN